MVHYAQGLIPRGFPPSPLKSSWHRFLNAKIPAPERSDFNKFFLTWLDAQNFAPTAVDAAAVASNRERATRSMTAHTLMCGKVALNHILRMLGKPILTDAEIDAVAQDKAAHERALLYSNAPNTILDLQADPRGNYSVEILLDLLTARSGEPVTRLEPLGNLRRRAPCPCLLLLVGCSTHWQAVSFEEIGGLCMKPASVFPSLNLSNFCAKNSHMEPCT